MTITLTREEAQQVLETLTFLDPRSLAASELQDDAIETLRARLAQPEPEPHAMENCSHNAYEAAIRARGNHD